MRLAEPSLLAATKKLYFYKLKAYANWLLIFIMVQIGIFLLSAFANLSPMSGTAAYGSGLIASYTTVSANITIVIAISLLTGVGILLTTKKYKLCELPLAANNTAGVLSDMSILVTASIFAGITSVLSGITFRIFVYFEFDNTIVITNDILLPLSDLGLGIISTSLYILIFSALGYFIGTLAQKGALYLIMAFAVYFCAIRMYPESTGAMIEFIHTETSALLFTLKVILYVAVLFVSSLILAQRTEVGK